MNDSKIAAKLRAQLKKFLGELLPHFSRPKVAFLGDMFYGLMAGGDVKLSKICRAYRPNITMKKAGDRLCMHLGADGLEKKLHEFVAKKVGRKVKPNTLIIADPSDVQKPYARQMEFLSKVWDGSKGDVGDNLGYYGCMAVACESGGRRPMPMHLRFWSPDAPGFTSENDELEKVFDILVSATGGKGIFIYDRGGDNIEFFRYFLRKDVDFVVRLKSRHVISWKRKLLCGDLAEQCTMRYADSITFDSHGKEVSVEIKYGVAPVRLPEISDKLLHMVVVRGFGQKPMMLLTTLAKATTRESLWQVVEGYITRWRVEDTIRYVKQAYNLEDIRLLRYSHLKNMAAIVLAATYFCMTWIGNSDKRDILAKAITDASLRIHELPDFHFYAIAEGIKMILSRCGRWTGFDEDPDDEPDLFKFFDCDDRVGRKS